MGEWLYELPAKVSKKQLQEALVEEGYDLGEVTLHSKMISAAQKRGASDDKLARLQEKIHKTVSMSLVEGMQERPFRYFDVLDENEKKIASFDMGLEDELIDFVNSTPKATYVVLFEKNSQETGLSKKPKYAHMLIWERDIDPIEELGQLKESYKIKLADGSFFKSEVSPDDDLTFASEEEANDFIHQNYNRDEFMNGCSVVLDEASAANPKTLSEGYELHKSDKSIADLKALVDSVYEELKKLPKPEASETGGEYYGGTQLFRHHSNVLELITSYQHTKRDSYDTSRYYPNVYCIKIGGAYGYKDYIDILKPLLNAFDYKSSPWGGTSIDLFIDNTVCSLIADYGSNYSVYGVAFEPNKNNRPVLDEDIEKHGILNPKLFENDELKPEVKEAIEKIADEFVQELAADGVTFDLKDIVLIGSNVSYNYTKDSDLDIHLVADSTNLHCPDDLYPLLYSAYRSMFNKNYDIKLKGIPAEIYVELDNIRANSKGMYSLKDGWLKKPVPEDVPEIDREAFERLFQEWEDKYFELISEKETELAEEEFPLDESLDDKLYGIFADKYTIVGKKFIEHFNDGKPLKTGSKKEMQDYRKAYEDSWNKDSQAKYQFKFIIREVK